MRESALLVVVPEAEPVVGDYRSHHDASSRLGIPAHVTVLFPFLPPDQIGSETRRELAAVLRDHSSFEFRLTKVGRFPTVVYLEPEPASAFAALTRAIWGRYPETPPYRGEHGSSITPHLTVGWFEAETDADAAEAEFRAVSRGRLPITGLVREVVLFASSNDGRWHPSASFPLAS